MKLEGVGFGFVERYALYFAGCNHINDRNVVMKDIRKVQSDVVIHCAVWMAINIAEDKSRGSQCG